MFPRFERSRGGKSGMRSTRAFLAVCRAEVRNAIGALKAAGPEDRLRFLLFGGLLIAFLVSAEYLSYRLFHSFLRVGGITVELIALVLMRRLLSLLFLVIQALLFFGAMIAAIDTLYFDEDIDFLASSPLSRRGLFSLKSLSVYFTTVWVAFLIVVPVMAGYTRALGRSYAHFPVSLGIFTLYTIPPVLAGIVTVTFLMKLMPVDKARGGVLAAGAVLSLFLVSFYRLLSPAKLMKVKNFSENFAEFLGELMLPGSPNLPFNLMTRAFQSAVPGKYAAAVGAAKGLGMYALGAIVLTGGLVGWFYETDRPVSADARKPSFLERLFRLDKGARALAERFPRGVRLLVYKEIMTNVRDPLQWSHLALLLAVVALHLANLREVPYYLHPAARVLVAFLNLGLAGFVTAAVAVRFVYPSISLEGKPFWTLQTAPLSARTYVLVKSGVIFLPLALVAGIVVSGANLLIRISAPLFLLWLGATLLICLAVTAMGIACGAAMPAFDKKNVFEISSSLGGIVFMLCSLLFVTSTIVLLVRPTYALAFMRSRFLHPLSLGCVIGLVVLSSIVTAVSYRIAVRAVERLGEE
ncbi:MAG: hypothetical protein D6679_00020 [Candidatus Hydrogenedentota bacterium]|nr:MAG: hypothetical protein D6679_00020 [Candidatus Hydrogenedentota bacterium]